MLSIPLPGLRPALVLLAILAGPAPAAVASHTTGYGGYGGYGGGCNSKYTGYSGYGYLSPCFAERPRPWISIDPPHPGAGQVITLSAENVREGSVAEWDTDNDGAFDDPETVSYPAGKKTVRVKVTDPDGRIGFATRSLNVHAGNLVPKVSITASQSAPRVGQQIDLRVTATDLDGQITAVALDLDDNGSFETPYPEGGPVTTSFTSAGAKRIRARATDSSGATAIAAIQVDVHTANRRPIVTIYAANSGGPIRVDQPVTLGTSAYDNDGTIASVAFDRDGDGTYETVPASGARSTTVTFTTTGRKRVGVRATDDGGATAEADIEVRVTADNDPPSTWLSQMSSNSRMFSVSAYDSDGIAEYAWDLDDDGVFDDLVGPGASTALIPGTTSGTVHVGVRVTDKLGAAVTRRQSFHVGVDKFDGPTIYSTGNIREGTTTYLNAMAGAPNATLEWDLDDDGAFDDGVGTYVGPRQFAAGTRKVAVRQTAGTDVRIARTQLIISPALGDWAPSLAISAMPSRIVRTGSPVSLSAWVNWATYTSWTFAWDLDGDGAYDDATGSSAEVTPATAGDHDVAVRATSTTPPVTLEQTTTLSVHSVNRPPLPTIGTFWPVQTSGGDVRVDQGTNVQFAASSFTTDDVIASTDWDLDGDGAFDDSTAAYPTKTFSTLGTFRVRVKVTDSGGATGTDTMNVRVTTPPPNRAPTVSLSGSQRVPVGSASSVWASASDPEGGAITYAWDLDEDGAFDDATGSNVSPTFTTVGTHRVRVRATDPAGATDTALLTIASYPASDIDPPSLSFSTPNLIRAGQPARIYASAYTQDGSSATITFDLDGDGQFDDVPTAGPPFSYTSLWTFPTAGPKTVSARAVDGAGRTRTVTRTLNVTGANLGPEVFISSYQTVVAGRPTWFSASGIDLDDDTVDVDWNYGGTCVLDWDLDGDGAYDDRHTETTWSCRDSASVTFPTINEEHTVGVRMTDDDGETAFHRTTFRVGSKAPSAAFSVSPTTVNPGQPVTLTSAASDDDGAIVERLWDLDDDGAFDDAGGSNTTVTFSELGVHLVGHKVRDDDGDIGIVYHPVSVVPVGPPPPPPTTGGEPSGGGGGSTGGSGGAGGSGGTGGSGGASGDTVKPKLTLVAPAKSALKLSRLGRGLPFRLTCSEPCRLTATATVTSAVRKQAKLKSTTVGRLSRTLRPGAPVTVAIKLDPKAVRALKRLRSVTLTLTFVVTDNAQNRTTRTQRVTLRR